MRLQSAFVTVPKSFMFLDAKNKSVDMSGNSVLFRGQKYPFNNSLNTVETLE